MAVIRTPVEGFSGPGVGGLIFRDGEAETNDEAVIAYARRRGYEVEETPKRKAPAKPETPKE
ncbi:hypothetical protein SEA_PICARD_8 [Streptomyces phage Picard]|uniref:Uncharacterized protein n=2 Tax=Picardvirus picard TaxID=2734264 RepID=A0A1J0MCE1_9CAUD|nr:hypothetical protein HOR45_gp08 [Streptomyces phage Picard]APD18586.1 hypothetical protein SEA_PICARD_8 [Streptomyces phage Picard]APD18650.1 hypothetical protein SEA_MOJORITA_8 [Streptomyces phage Mojorita]